MAADFEDRELEARLRAYRPVGPPADLRERVVSLAAEEATPQRRAPVAWLALAALLLLALALRLVWRDGAPKPVTTPGQARIDTTPPVPAPRVAPPARVVAHRATPSAPRSREPEILVPREDVAAVRRLIASLRREAIEPASFPAPAPVSQVAADLPSPAQEFDPTQQAPQPAPETEPAVWTR